MTPFRFPLERVLDWRRLQMRAEEEKLAALQHRLDLMNRRMSSLIAAEQKCEWGLRKQACLDGAELQALAAFQSQAKKQREGLALEQRQCEKQIEAQRARLVKSRKDYRILEKLKERRHQAWSYEADREVENTAAEAHIAKFIRDRSDA